MALDGPGFHVEVDVLDEAAGGIKKCVEDQESFELRGLCGESEQYGHTPLRDAFMDFCVRWSDGLDDLVADGEEISDALTKVADAYRNIDQAAARGLTGDPGVEAADG